MKLMPLNGTYFRLLNVSFQVPISSASVDVAVFCLSLMGTNLVDFLREAHRVLKPGYVKDSLLLIYTHIFRQILCCYGRLTCLDKSNNVKCIYTAMYHVVLWKTQPKLFYYQVLIYLV